MELSVALLDFRGIMLGLGCAIRGNSGGRALLEMIGSSISSFGVGGAAFGKFVIVGIGGGFIVLILFNRRASVGLIVLAPRPEALPEAMD